MTNEQPPATNDEYPSFVTPPMERPTRNRNIEPDNRGGYQEIGLDPGAFGAVYRGNVASHIGDSRVMDALGIFDPLATMDAHTAPNRIFDGLLHSEITAEGSNPTDYLTALSDIEKNPNRSGQEWFDALPKGMKKQFEDLDLIPVNAKNLDAYTVARDMKQSLAWMVNSRDAAVGSSKRSWLTNTASGLALGAVTDPTNLVSFGLGRAAGKVAAKAAAGLVKSKASTLLSKKLAANLGAQALLQQTTVAQNAMARNETSQRLGITPGQATQSEINKEGLLAAAQGAGLGFAFHAAGYYGAARVSKTKKAIVDTVFKYYVQKMEKGGIGMSDQRFAELASRVYDDKPMDIPEHLVLLTEVTNAAYGTVLTPDVWDVDAMNAVGLHPSDLTRQVFEGGFSGKQMQQKMSIVDMVLEDATNNHAASPALKIPYAPFETPVQNTGPFQVPMRAPEPSNAKVPYAPAKEAGTPAGQFRYPMKPPEPFQGQVPMAPPAEGATASGPFRIPMSPVEPSATATPTPTSPVVALKPLMKMGALPKDVTDAGFMWGPLGEIIPDPAFVRPAGTPAAPVEPVSPVTTPVPVKQPLMADYVPDITPRKATAAAAVVSTATPAAENLVSKNFRESTSLKDFEKRIEILRIKLESQGGAKLVATFDKKWSETIAKLKTGYDEGKANLVKITKEAAADHQTVIVTKEQLVERAKAIGAGDTVLPLNNRKTDAAKGIEIPNLKDRLIWMAGRGMKETAKARALLLEFYGMTEADVRAARDKMEAVIPSAPGKGLDRIRVTQDAQGVYSAEVLKIATDPTATPKKVKPSKNLPADPNGTPDKVARYIKQRNDAIQRRLDAEANKPVKAVAAKTPETPAATTTAPSTFSPKEGLDPKVQAQYEELIKNGSLKQAYELLDKHMVGEGHYESILQLSAETEIAKNSLEYNLRIGSEEEINKARAELTRVNTALAARKEQLFAWSPDSLKALDLKKPLKATNGQLTNFVLGTHYEPDAAHYTEPLAGTDSHKPTAEVIQVLDAAFANVPLTADASSVSTNIPKGIFNSLANSILSLNSAIMGRSDAAKVLLSGRPMLAQLINFISPFRLTSEGELGTNKMTPWLESGFSRIKSSTNAMIIRSTDELRAIGIHRFTPEYGDVVFDALRERITGNGPLPSTKNRAAVDIVLKHLGQYFDDSGKEALAIGKISKFDPKYARLILTRKASFQIEKVSGIFHEIMADHFALDASKIHNKTLDSLVSTVVAGADEKPVKTFGELKKANPTLANAYLKALRSTERSSPLYDMASKSIRTRMGLDVEDATSISTDADFHMNSGLGQTIDQKLLVDPRMQGLIETDIGAIASEYDKNIRYYVHRQKAVDQFLSNITGRKITGITLGDAMKYFKMKDVEASPAHTKEIDALYAALEQREGMINGRRRADASKDLLLDSAAIAASTPIQSSVAAGVSSVSQAMENLRSLIVSIPAAWDARSSGRGFVGNLYELFLGMSRKELFASAELMHTASVRGAAIEFDGAHDNYVGGSFLGQKVSNLIRLLSEVKKSATEPVDSKSARTHRVTQAVSNVVVEGPRQILMNEDMVAKAVQRYWWMAQYEAAEHLSNLMSKPDYLTKLPRNEMINHMEAAGLFSKEALDGIKAINKKYPRFLEGRFKWEQLQDTLIKLKEDPNISNVDVKNASQFLSSYWNMLDRYSDTKVMSSPRLWDRANPNINRAYLRLSNTFTGYTRWYFSRNAFQNFPNSSMGKVGGLLATTLLTEIGIKMIMDIARDPKGAADKLSDPEELKAYLWKGAANVPLLGELSSNAGSAVSAIHDTLLPESKPLGMGNPRGHSMFEFKSWLPQLTEVKKMISGDDYEFEKVRKLIPILNSPIIGGFLKATGVQESKSK